MDRDELYAQAGVGPADIDFLETYDDYPVINVLQFEDLGFCGKGEGTATSSAPTPLKLTARFPCNTSGGQLSVGQAGAAGGHLGVVEAIRQLTGRTLRRARRGCAIWPRLGLRHDQLRSRHLQRRRRARRRLMRKFAGQNGGQSLQDGRSAKTRSCARGSRRCRRRRAAASRSALPPPRRAGGWNCKSAVIAARCSIRRAKFAAPASPPAGLAAARRRRRTSRRHRSARRAGTFFRERLPWRIGMVRLDGGVNVVAYVHESVRGTRHAACASKPRSTAPGRPCWSRCRQTGGPTCPTIRNCAK